MTTPLFHLRFVALVSGLYDLLVGIALLVAAPTMARLFGVAPLTPAVFGDTNALFLIVVGLGYWKPWRDPELHRWYLWLMGPILKGAGAAVFVRDVWFKYTATETNILTVYTCDQASFDTRLAAYDGACGTLNLVGCNDDNQQCSMPWTSRMDFVVEEGVTYYIRVGSFADTGGGSITLAF